MYLKLVNLIAKISSKLLLRWRGANLPVNNAWEDEQRAVALSINGNVTHQDNYYYTNGGILINTTYQIPKYYSLEIDFDYLGQATNDAGIIILTSGSIWRGLGMSNSIGLYLYQSNTISKSTGVTLQAGSRYVVKVDVLEGGTKVYVNGVKCIDTSTVEYTGGSGIVVGGYNIGSYRTYLKVYSIKFFDV